MNQLKRYECPKHGGGENRGGFCYNCANDHESEKQAKELPGFRSTPGNRSTLREKLKIAEKRIEKLTRDIQSAGELFAIACYDRDESADKLRRVKLALASADTTADQLCPQEDAELSARGEGMVSVIGAIREAIK